MPQQLRGAEHDAAAQKFWYHGANVSQVEAHGQLPLHRHLALLAVLLLLLLLMVEQPHEVVPFCEAGIGLSMCFHCPRRRLLCYPICWGALLCGPVDIMSCWGLLFNRTTSGQK